MLQICFRCISAREVVFVILSALSQKIAKEKLLNCRGREILTGQLFCALCLSEITVTIIRETCYDVLRVPPSVKLTYIHLRIRTRFSPVLEKNTTGKNATAENGKNVTGKKLTVKMLLRFMIGDFPFFILCKSSLIIFYALSSLKTSCDFC